VCGKGRDGSPEAVIETIPDDFWSHFLNECYGRDGTDLMMIRGSGTKGTTMAKALYTAFHDNRL